MSTSHRLTRSLPLAAALLFLFLAHAPARSQSKEPQQQKPRPKESRTKESPKKETQARVFCDTARAVSLVETQLSEAKAFADPLKRIGVMTRAADLLWPSERETARAVFSDAFDLASVYFRERGDETRHDKGRADSKLSGITIQLPDQRFEVIRAIARHDSAWARELALRAADETRAEAEKENAAAAEGERRPVGEKLLGFAETLLPTDFQTALSVARTTFRDPATMYLPQFLYAVAKIDRGAADAFYKDALTAYADRDTTSLLYLSTYPFALPYPILSSLSYVFSVKPEGFAGDPELQRQYVAAFLRLAERRLAALAQQPPPDAGPYKQSESEIIYLSLRAIESTYGAQQPQLLERIAALEGQAVVLLSPEQQRSLTSGNERGTASSPFSGGDRFDEMIEQAERLTDPDKRDSRITSAIIAVGEVAPLEKVEDAARKIGDAETRRQVQNWLYFARAQGAVRSGALDDARKLAEHVEALDERAMLFLEIADSGLKRAGDSVRAEELLDAVVAAAGKAPETETKARALLGVAYLYTKLDRQRAFEVAGDAVKTINRLRDPDLDAAYLMRKIQGKSFGLYMTHTVPGFRLENSFRELGALDFESALSAASNLSDRYLRSLATLGLASKCLEDSAAKPGNKTRNAER